MIPNDAVVHMMFSWSTLKLLSLQRRHLDIEERLVLPLIAESFTTQDWQTVES